MFLSLVVYYSKYIESVQDGISVPMQWHIDQIWDDDKMNREILSSRGNVSHIEVHLLHRRMILLRMNNHISVRREYTWHRQYDRHGQVYGRLYSLDRYTLYTVPDTRSNWDANVFPMQWWNYLWLEQNNRGIWERRDGRNLHDNRGDHSILKD